MAGLVVKLLIFLPALAVSTALAAQGNPGCGGEITVDSSRFFFDGNNNNLIHFVRPTITKCGLKIEAEDAFSAGVDFDARAEWTFMGHVRVTADGKSMEADSAVFVFDKNQLSQGELVGAPASFSAARAEPGKEPVRGSANKIFFDYVAQTLRMSEHVVVTRDRVRWQGCDVIYDFKNEGVRSGNVDCAEDYKIRIVPPQANATPNAPP